jgi:hypothetical protein
MTPRELPIEQLPTGLRRGDSVSCTKPGFADDHDMSIDDLAAAGDVKPTRITPRVLGSPQGSEFGDIVAVDGGIIEWLERHRLANATGSARASRDA